MKEVANTDRPLDLLFGGMAKLAPGGNVHTLNVLRLLPRDRFEVIVDAGCGTGRQTLALAQELRTLVHAIDLHAPFLNDLTQSAESAQIADLVRTHCSDLKDIPSLFPHIDLLWSESPDCKTNCKVTRWTRTTISVRLRHSVLPILRRA